MRIPFAGLCLVSTLATGVAFAQPLPFNEAGVTMGHWHFVSHDVDANRRIFVGMGGQALSRPGGAESVRFPGVLINLNFGQEPPGKGGTVGSVVNHVGFVVNNVQEQVAKWKAAGVAVLLPTAFNRTDQAFVETPDGVRIEILEDKSQAVPIRHEHIHFFLPEAEIIKAVAWYAKHFGGKVSERNKSPVVDIPGAQLRFAKANGPQAPTKGRVLDHIGFDVKDLNALIRKIEADGIKLDEPYRKNPLTGSAITYITDPWGARLELVERGPMP
jgi:catechol 2,3-dioxygenase-like lactoylglutathione lyase family enzyme/predicted enzyme related to lactoylglutathione lyase